MPLPQPTSDRPSAARTLGEREKARGHLGVTREMIGRMGYHLRDEEVRELEAQLGEVGE